MKEKELDLKKEPWKQKLLDQAEKAMKEGQKADPELKIVVDRLKDRIANNTSCEIDEYINAGSIWAGKSDSMSF